MELKSLLVSTKSTEVDFPGIDGFKVEVNFLSREETIKIRKKATKVTWKNRQQVDDLDEDLFLKLYVGAVIKGWKGLKLKYLTQLVPVDLSASKDLEAELEFSADNALQLMKNSSEFDSFITDTVSDLSNFQ